MSMLRLCAVLMLLFRCAAHGDSAPAYTCPVPGLWHGECHFHDSVFVGPGDTVFISAGTQVVFSGPHASLEVAGALFAFGYADDSITLVARDVAPDFAWNLGGTSVILYTVLRGAPKGISLEEGSLDLGYARLEPVSGTRNSIQARNASLRFECFSPDTLVRTGSVQVGTLPCQETPEYSPAHWRNQLAPLAETYRHHPEIGQNHFSAVLGFRGMVPDAFVRDRFHGDSLHSLEHQKIRLAGTWYLHPDFAIRSAVDV